MKKKLTLKKATVAVGVVAMSVGLFNSFNIEANGGSSGFKCCKYTYLTCYHPDCHTTYADSNEYTGGGECPPDPNGPNPPIWT